MVDRSNRRRLFTALTAVLTLLSLLGFAGPAAAAPAQAVSVWGWVNVPAPVDAHKVQVVISRPNGQEVARVNMAGGKYRFTGLTPGDYHLQVTDCSDWLYDPAPTKLYRLTKATEIRHLSGTLGGKVAGRVSGPQGVSPDRVRVEYLFRRFEGGSPVSVIPVKPDSQGRFELGRLAPGYWEVKASLDHPGMGVLVQAKAVQVSAGSRQSVELEVRPYSISGRITVPTGVDYRDVRVMLRDRNFNEREGELRPDGSYTFSVASGNYQVWALSSKRLDVPSVLDTLYPDFVGGGPQEPDGWFSVEADMTGVDIKPPGLGVVAGSVVLPAGVPTSDVEIHLICCDYQRKWRESVPLGSDGSYKIRFPITYGGIISAKSKSVAFPDTFYPGTTAEEKAPGLDNPRDNGIVQLAPMTVQFGGTLSGTVKAPPGQSSDDYTVQIWRRDGYFWERNFPVVSGAWKATQLPEGTYTLCIFRNKNPQELYCKKDAQGQQERFRLNLGDEIKGIEISSN